jgi:hypothetical protein
MKKEYDLLLEFDENELCGVFYTIQTAIEQKSHDLLDLESCKSKVDEAFRALACQRRLTQLNKMLRSAIKFSRDGFTLDNHKFETLDEIERAYKLKAFL